MTSRVDAKFAKRFQGIPSPPPSLFLSLSLSLSLSLIVFELVCGMMASSRADDDDVCGSGQVLARHLLGRLKTHTHTHPLSSWMQYLLSKSTNQPDSRPGNKNDAESIWQWVQKMASQNKKGKNGSDLDEFEAHKFIESLGEAMTAMAMRERLREIDVNSDKKMALTEYAIYILYFYFISISTADARQQNKKKDTCCSSSGLTALGISAQQFLWTSPRWTRPRKWSKRRRRRWPKPLLGPREPSRTRSMRRRRRPMLRRCLLFKHTGACLCVCVYLRATGRLRKTTGLLLPSCKSSRMVSSVVFSRHHFAVWGFAYPSKTTIKEYNKKCSDLEKAGEACCRFHPPPTGLHLPANSCLRRAAG